MHRKKVEIYNLIKENFLLPLFSSDDINEAINVVSAVKNANCKVVELTHREKNSYKVFESVRQKFENLKIIIGAGSVIDEVTAGMYINAGADFIVSPNFNAKVLRYCNKQNILYIPGCATLTEILNGYEEGAIVVKLFPAAAIGGVNFLKNILAPCPWIEVLISGGAEPTSESIKEWISAGAVALSMGAKLLSKELIKEKKWEEITAKTRFVLKIIKEIRLK